MTTSSASVLSALAARVEAGHGEDPGLDFDIALAFGWEVQSLGKHDDWPPEPYLAPPTAEKRFTVRAKPPAWSSSLDAVVALIAERLPGWRWDRISERNSTPGYGHNWVAALWLPVDPQHPTRLESIKGASCATECRARLSVFLRALADQQDRQTEGESHG